MIKLDLRKPLIALAGLVLAGAVLSGCSDITRQLQTSAPPPRGIAPAGGDDVVRARLGSLRVENPHPVGKYERAKFGRDWASQGRGCDTRETVLRVQGLGVRTDAQCRAIAGSWRSPYDDKLWSRADQVDIDHVVPLGEAWASGAWAWTPARRIEFANDLTDPQLIAVTDTLNQQKGDRRPDQWKPPLVSYWHTYASNWITVKAKFGLTITATEKSALELMLR
jgi:hypothetical protein